jgi:two-component system nitrate/nitrite response regulator NarL
MASGFHGYISKDLPITQLVSHLHAVLTGEVRFIGWPTRSAPTTGPWSEESYAALSASQLTRRELEVIELLAEGADATTMSRALMISPNTVRTHIRNVLSKLQVHSRLEAVAFATRHRLVPTQSSRPGSWSGGHRRAHQ